MDKVLQQTIEEANRKAALGRQKACGRKFSLLRTDKEVVDMLCQRATELLLAHKAGQSVVAHLENLAAAVRIAEKRKGKQ